MPPPPRAIPKRVEIVFERAFEPIFTRDGMTFDVPAMECRVDLTFEVTDYPIYAADLQNRIVEAVQQELERSDETRALGELAKPIAKAVDFTIAEFRLGLFTRLSKLLGTEDLEEVLRRVEGLRQLAGMREGSPEWLTI